ncbi:hypothetical protein KFK09_006478 [Dendrobium nobile]|uniref:Uncharacterized protein n=1 Tax=Dendrobium nobile TaxID=94219 RepID=A0A8T3BPQ2_DENNO|nr:hypothetical protein KFK09_006478 [Dendrobium nobile]
MDSEQIQWTLDLIVDQLGMVTQQIRETKEELVDFRMQAGECLDNIERLGHPTIYTPSKPHSPYVDENRTEYKPPRDHYSHNPRPNHEPVGQEAPWRDNDAQLLRNIRIDDNDAQLLRNIRINAPSFDGTLEHQVFLDWLKGMDSYFR